MPRRRLSLLLHLPVAFVLAACSDAPEDDEADATQQRLVGTWLRAYEDQGVRVRRILVLESDGQFREMASMRSSDGSAEPSEATASGRWLYDGTNLKRHYRTVNGLPMSAPQIPFATFEIQFSSRNRFLGLDRVRRISVEYERVADGTEP